MSACDITIGAGFGGLPDQPAFEGLLGQLQEAGRARHSDVSSTFAEFWTALEEAQGKAYFMKNSPMVSNPLLTWLGGAVVESINNLSTVAAEVEKNLDAAFQGFEVATGGVGSPDRVAAISQLLDAEVSSRLVELADEVAVSRLNTPDTWNSSAVEHYLSRADEQSTDGMRPLAEAAAGVSLALEKYADSQLDCAEEIAAIWFDLLISALSISALIGSLTATLGGFGTASTGGAVSMAIGAIGFISLAISALTTGLSCERLVARVEDYLAMPNEPCENLRADLESASDAINFRWPQFAKDV